MKLVLLTDETSKMLNEMMEDLGATDVASYNMDTGSKVIYSVENGREHISISNKKRYPTWEEIKYVRYKLMKQDTIVAQILPPKSDYINVHENCFHLWEINDDGITTVG